ncbi:carboxymuconolactone decarboxylase family protein [Thalassolituus pacificus]|uniref:Carboxymuconolactone decarboxylase family protein n=1 Tax=Thalassolituus pacificus TaxID=2975440 RepID=A0A9X2WDE1_9GAMM|nr:carboxymuconolactone decarboxylase family protein [Thalassolituus pacificus]MCT7358359.1 carboxymuconolactone decarboxylase family protein [Thalassolituus pacificus]
MTQRLNYYQAAPAAMNPLMAGEQYLKECGLEKSLLELVKLRVSQLNGCAYCLDMHSKDARAEGESEQRLYTLSAWREAPFFSLREQAALAWAEALTLVSQQHPAEQLLDDVRKSLSDAELTSLTLAICNINSWNRFAVGFGADVGSYQPGDFG